jgi:hypothetical protein
VNLHHICRKAVSSIVVREAVASQQVPTKWCVCGMRYFFKSIHISTPLHLCFMFITNMSRKPSSAARNGTATETDRRTIQLTMSFAIRTVLRPQMSLHTPHRHRYFDTPIKVPSRATRTPLMNNSQCRNQNFHRISRCENLLPRTLLV